MRVDRFDFDLPPELIALRPVSPRDASRLLVVRDDGSREHRLFRDVPDLLRAGDVIVVNDSKVILARLTGRRLARGSSDGANIEVTLHKRLSPSSYLAFARPAKRVQEQDRLQLGTTLAATVLSRAGGEIELAFDRGGAALDAAIAAEGAMPLPPYIAGKRKPDERDRSDYQTVYAAEPGSVASPTAGLHFTPGLLADLERRGIGRQDITLHVGAGTFLPVATDNTEDHRMRAEHAEITASVARALNTARAAGGRIVAVGSTAARTLECATTEDGVVEAFSGDTALFITPGYRFQAVDVLLTNFHLPRSTLFMLVCAFCGIETMKAAYADAIAERYRFYSYGDACLLFRMQ